MKKLAIKLVTGFVLLVIGVFILQSFSKDPKAVFDTKYINFEATSSGGCTVTFNGYVEYTLNPPNPPDITRYVGTVTLDGHCKNYTATYDAAATITTDPATGEITAINWTTLQEPRLVDDLTNPLIEAAFEEYLEHDIP